MPAGAIFVLTSTIPETAIVSEKGAYMHMCGASAFVAATQRMHPLIAHLWQPVGLMFTSRRVAKKKVLN